MMLRWKSTWIARACAALWVLGLFAGRAAAEPERRPNIVFAIADDWGWPHASAYGDPAVKTPAFDQIAREGVLFTNAYVSSPSCTPSRGAIITGQHFFRLDQGANLYCVWPEGKFAELPALLEAAGYHIGSYRKGWGPGKAKQDPAGKRYRPLDEFFAAREAGQPFFLWFGAIDPHRPYREGIGREHGIDPNQVHRFAHFPDTQEVRSDVADYYWEVQRFDRDVLQLLKRLEAMHELDNTIILMTGDHGMPFPRCKANLYDSGTRVPLAVRWGADIPADRTVTDFVSLTDIAPTLLEAAGLPVPEMMTGRSLLGTLRSDKEGRVDASRDQILFGRERHVPAQEAPDSGGYPSRGLRTDDFLYIRNFAPHRWPAGTPDYKNAFVPNCWLGDCDNGATKMFLWEHRDDPQIKPYYDLAFAKRPAEELYDLRSDPDQLHNVAGDPHYASIRAQLAKTLTDQLRRYQDPRIVGGAERFDQYDYLGHGPRWPGE